MKAKNEFMTNSGYKEYLIAYYTGLAMQSLTTIYITDWTREQIATEAVNIATETTEHILAQQK